jgi:hypothetical protein
MRTIKELQDLGWIKRPTALENYLINTALQNQFKTYEDYSLECYKASKENWVGIGNISHVETRKYTSTKEYLDFKDHYFFTKNLELETPKELIKEINIDKNKNHLKYKTTYFGIKIKKLKNKTKKVNKLDLVKQSTTCPYCLSLLKINDVKVLECTGNKLRIWEKEFLTFNQLIEDKKNKYLLGLSDVGLFLDLYEKWNKTDEKGNRVNFTCGYSNKLFNPISKFRTSFPDPILVKRIEKSLGKELSYDEKWGLVDVYKEGNTYFRTWKKGRQKVKIPQIIFPDGVI